MPLADVARALRVAAGDWQTPDALADRVVALLAARGIVPAVVLEPTCGDGAFLAAAARAFPGAELVGVDVASEHVAAARARLGPGATVERADFFEVDWRARLDAIVAGARGPLLVLGNPPWVTSATLGALGATNHPEKRNDAGARGLDAKTGKANFDVSEWMIARLVSALRPPSTLAMLCKASVARRVLATAWERGAPVEATTYKLDARAHFDAAVDAVLLVVSFVEGARASVATQHATLDPRCASARTLALVDGELTTDPDAFVRTQALVGASSRSWRSGIKHDCARVFELTRIGGELMNGLGEVVRVEEAVLHPLRKCTDLARDRGAEGRFVLVTQRALGDDTKRLRASAPRAWAYLEAHRAELDGRKSSVYRGRPPFSMFGVGPYAFSPFKVAVSGLHKEMAFRVLAPQGGLPVLLDDTCYFVPCEDRASAERVAGALASPIARDFFGARIFRDAKRPVTKTLLEALSIDRLLAANA